MSDRSVLLVVSGNSYAPGIWTHHTAALWRETAREFSSVHVFARSTAQRFWHGSMENVHVHLIPRGPARMLTFFVTSWWLPMILIKVRPAYIQAQSPVHGGLACIVWGRLLGIPVMLELHGEHYVRGGQVGGPIHKWFIRPLTSLAFHGATRIRSLSSEMTQEISALYGASARRKIVEIPNRVDLGVFSPPKSSYSATAPLNLVSVGALNANKNQLNLIRDLSETGGNYSLTLVGDGPLRQELVAEGQRLGLSVTVTGLLTHSQLRAVLQQHDVYVHYSHSEAVSRAILEAMAMGLPVVVAPGGFMGGVIEPGVNGLRLAEKGPAPLREALDTLDNALVREQMGTAARERIETQHEWKRVFALHAAAVKRMRCGTSRT